MKKLFIYILFSFLTIFLVAQQTDTQNKAQLASSFYRNNDFEKAAPLYLELYETTRVNYYFDNYINCLVGLKNYDEAEKALKKELRKHKTTTLQISLGFVYKEKGEIGKAYSVFDEVIEGLNKSKGAIISVANTFFTKREMEYAEKTYLRGRELLEGEMFRPNIATVYAYTRNYDKMMEEYIFMLKEDETGIASVEGRLNSLLRFDFDNSLREAIRREILKAIQQYPDILAYNRLLIWFFVQDENYKQALTHSIALDKRTKTEENDIMDFSRSAAQLKLFDVALEGLNYLAERKPPVKNLDDVRKQLVRTEYSKYISLPKKQRGNAKELVQKFNNILDEYGFSNQTVEFSIDYAHFLAFHLENTGKANEVLEKALQARDLNNQQRSALKVEQADIMVYDNQLWEATLLYAQIIDANRENSLGDDVKLKKAKLSFYLGEIGWAKAQLDVLKASTSKLIANDAMDLSLLITASYELDTISEPLQLFARGDLLTYQNKDSLAIATYDSIVELFPGHMLQERILMRKAMISEKNFDFEKAVSYYEEVAKNHSWSTSADDALYKMALIYETRLNNSEKAQELYKQIMLSYPGSIYTEDSRNRFRILRGDKIEEEDLPDYEAEFFRGL
ncbi:MAG: tetratricopeptide repeat protein [Prolixibacteraceae bacterium]|nr:tetratricopeptide repeat protein [Prolixibacteraceae bacterium]